MTKLDDAARSLADSPMAQPTPIEGIYRRAESLRRRTRRRIGALSVVVVGVAVVSGVNLSSAPTNRFRVSAGPPATIGALGSTTPPSPTTGAPPTPAPPTAIAPPARLVAHLPDATGVPGQIAVMQTATGAITKVLGADYDPYVGDGFHIAAGGGAVFWSHLDQPNQLFPITEAALDTGAERIIANGFGDLPSPDSKYLLVEETGTVGLELVDLKSGGVTSLPALTFDGQNLGSVAWLPDSRTILGLSVTVSTGPCMGPPESSCSTTTTTPAQAVTHAWTLDTSDPRAAWVGSLPSDSRWNGLQLLGPGRLPGTVVAARAPVYSSVNDTVVAGPEQLLTVSAEGTVIDRLTLAVGVHVLAVDHTGNNFLVTDSAGLARLSLVDPTPIQIGQNVSEASWW